ncbi:unnamed protein product [Rotaria sp. Silwood1]|nr:unnamed protein product [Rotaria sp. Silwood1]
MHSMLNNYPVSFPPRYEQSCTLKEFLNEVNTSCDNQYKLPIIVNIMSLNSYGRSIKNLLSKATSLLLLDICQLNSILAEYHRSSDGRQHFHRTRLTLTQGKVSAKASAKFLSMKKISKSLASLTTINIASNMSDDDNLDGDNDNTYNQRNLIKVLNGKRSSSVPLCRIPKQYQSFFELLNENDQPIQPCHKLSDLIINEQDSNGPENHIANWPHAFFLRSYCNAYTKKYTPEIIYSTENEQTSKVASSTEPIYASITDLDLEKNLIELNDDVQILQPGQVLTIVNVCYAFRKRILDREQKEQQQPISPSSSLLSPATWMKEKSKIFLPKKRRQTVNTVNVSHEHIQSKFSPNKSEPCLKCQTQQGDDVYIFLDESGSFSPLNCQTDDSKFNTELNRMSLSGVFQLKDILSNFRFPISVRLLDGLSSVDNINSAILYREESSRPISTKLRLLAKYNENVVFACPLNLLSQKSQKTSSPCIVIPLSVTADIEIQPCLNMSDISKTESFQKLIETCFQIIKQYQTEISLINIPLQLNNNTRQRKPPLLKKRSQSDSNLDEVSQDQFRHSGKQSNSICHFLEDSSSTIYTAYVHRDSNGTFEENLSSDAKQGNSASGDSVYYGKSNKNQQKGSYSHIRHTSEDEIFEDVDKLYDYIRSGDVTYDVERIKAKEQGVNSTHAMDIPSAIAKETEQQTSSANNSPDKMMRHRFYTKANNSHTPNHCFEMYQCRNEGNVDDDEARALFLADKQRLKDDSKNSANVKSTTPMKTMNKH